MFDLVYLYLKYCQGVAILVDGDCGEMVSRQDVVRIFRLTFFESKVIITINALVELPYLSKGILYKA